MIEPSLDEEVERRIAEQRIFGSDTVEVGRFEKRPDDPLFRRSGPPGRYLVALPETSVEIAHDRRSPFVTNLNTVTFYNPEDDYQRIPVAPEGDRCTWIAFDPELVEEVLHRFDDDGGNGFRHRFGPAGAESFVAGRRLLATLRSGETDALEIEELATEILSRVVASSYACRDGLRDRQSDLGTAARRQHRRILKRVLVAMEEASLDGPSLAELAKVARCSKYHLCRVFRQETGTTLHSYLTELRVRRALDLIRTRDLRLVDVAVEVGFSSHSHMTATFQRVLGAAPSELR